MDQSNPEDFSERERYLPLSVCLTDRLLDYLTARLPDTAISRDYLCVGPHELIVCRKMVGKILCGRTICVDHKCSPLRRNAYLTSASIAEPVCRQCLCSISKSITNWFRTLCRFMIV